MLPQRYLVCRDGMVLANNTCVVPHDTTKTATTGPLVEMLIPQCMIADVSGCLQCDDKSFPNSDNTCHHCPANCVKCTRHSHCM